MVRAREPQKVNLSQHFGVRVAEISTLEELVLNDLDIEAGGVGWWPDVPVHHRILLGDFAYQAAAGIPAQMVNAHVALSRLEQMDLEEQRRWRTTAAGGHRGYPAESVAEAISGVEARVAMATVASSLSRALDLGAAVVVIAFDVPRIAKRADWNQVQRSASDDIAWMVNIEDKHGPMGWMHWFAGLRNTLTHRPSNLDMKQVMDKSPPLHLPDSVRADYVHLVRHLPSDPDLSFVEALADAQPEVGRLSESAGTTLKGLVNSTNDLIEDVAGRCAEQWVNRRSAGKQQLNYERQWKQHEPAPFSGYSPGHVPFEGRQAVMNPAMGRRLAAAHLTDQVRDQTWGEWLSGSGGKVAPEQRVV